MANLVHRTTRNGRYSLRGYAPIIITQRQTPAQRMKDITARGLKKDWQITRAIKRSRGLYRVNNSCFILSGVQTLFHLPGFQNWILSHNSREAGTVNFPCRSLKDIGDALGLSSKLPRCPACVVKQCLQEYWGAFNIDAATDYPRAFPHAHPRMVALRNLGRALGAGGGVNQEDVCEFQDRLLRACLASTDYTLTANTLWLEHYNALFILEWDTTWQCECGTLQVPPHGTNPVDSVGHNGLGILPEGQRDSIALAMARNLAPETLPGLRDCTVCPIRRHRTQTIRIDAAPEYLRIKLNVVTPVVRNGALTGETTRNDNPVGLTHILDLTRYQNVTQYPVPLKYRLIGAMCHTGGTGHGHYTATVTGPPGERVSHIDDHRVAVHGRDYMRKNPHENLPAVVVWYVRVLGRSG